MLSKTNLITYLIRLLFLVMLCTAVMGKTIYVDDNANGANNGSSWANAYNYLQDALADANSAEKLVEIWVAQGVYTPDSNSTVPDGTGDREATLQIINGVTIYGGFPPGVGEWQDRDPNVYETVLSGDLDGNDVDVSDPCDLLNEPSRAENSYYVVTGSETDSTAILDGFTIAGGYKSGMFNYNGSPIVKNCRFTGNSGSGMLNLNTFSDSQCNPILKNCIFSVNATNSVGGGMFNEKGNPTLVKCIFIGNEALCRFDARGGGMYNAGGNPTLVECRFSGNKALGEFNACGGGMYNVNSNLMMTDCNFIDNSSAYEGGGMYNWSSNLTLVHCTFSGNEALGQHGEGGGMYNNSQCKATLTNCTFVGNEALGQYGIGGGMYSFDSNLMLTDCNFTDNLAKFGGGGISNVFRGGGTIDKCTFKGNKVLGFVGSGGAMYNLSISNLKLTNCKFMGNSAPDGGGIDNNGNNLTIINCVFVGNCTTRSYGDGGGMHNFDSNPTLTNCIFMGNSAGNGGGMHNSGSNPTLINCMFIANLVSSWGSGVENWESNPTLTNCTFAGNSGPKGRAIAIYNWYQSNPILTNCILWDMGNEIWYDDSSLVTVTYSNVQGSWPGYGNINTDPYFVEPGYWDPNGTPAVPDDDFWVDGDYHLKSQAGRWDPNSESWVIDDVTSPCIDAGDPNSPIGDEPIPNGGRINMGAYGGTAEASKSP